MKKWIVYCIACLVLVSCGEELIPKPNNLISKEKMADVIQEFAIINAAKTTNSAVFRDNNIEPTDYILAKFEIDSLQYVASDRYYVSKPTEYEKIFEIVEKRLEIKAKAMSDAKRKGDSIFLLKQREDAAVLQKQRKLNNDSLPRKIDTKKQ